MTESSRHSHAARRLDPIYAALYGLGLIYVTALAAFAVSFAHPPAIGWLGFAIVCAVVIAIMTALGQFLTRAAGRPRP